MGRVGEQLRTGVPWRGGWAPAGGIDGLAQLPTPRHAQGPRLPLAVASSVAEEGLSGLCIRGLRAPHQVHPGFPPFPSKFPVVFMGEQMCRFPPAQQSSPGSADSRGRAPALEPWRLPAQAPLPRAPLPGSKEPEMRSRGALPPTATPGSRLPLSALSGSCPSLGALSGRLSPRFPTFALSAGSMSGMVGPMMPANC